MCTDTRRNASSHHALHNRSYETDDVMHAPESRNLVRDCSRLSPNRHTIRRPPPTVLAPEIVRDIAAIGLNEDVRLRRRLRGGRERGQGKSRSRQGFHTTTDMEHSVPRRIFGGWSGLDADDVGGWVLEVDVVVVTDRRLGADGRGGIRTCGDARS